MLIERNYEDPREFAEAIAKVGNAFGAQITPRGGYRPGATTTQGDPSLHGGEPGMAIDLQIAEDAANPQQHERMMKALVLAGYHAIVEAPGSTYAAAGNKGYVVHAERRAPYGKSAGVWNALVPQVNTYLGEEAKRQTVAANPIIQFPAALSAFSESLVGEMRQQYLNEPHNESGFLAYLQAKHPGSSASLGSALYAGFSHLSDSTGSIPVNVRDLRAGIERALRDPKQAALEAKAEREASEVVQKRHLQAEYTRHGGTDYAKATGLEGPGMEWKHAESQDNTPVEVNLGAVQVTVPRSTPLARIQEGAVGRTLGQFRESAQGAATGGAFGGQSTLPTDASTAEQVSNFVAGLLGTATGFLASPGGMAVSAWEGMSARTSQRIEQELYRRVQSGDTRAVKALQFLFEHPSFARVARSTVSQVRPGATFGAVEPIARGVGEGRVPTIKEEAAGIVGGGLGGAALGLTMGGVGEAAMQLSPFARGLRKTEVAGREAMAAAWARMEDANTVSALEAWRIRPDGTWERVALDLDTPASVVQKVTLAEDATPTQQAAWGFFRTVAARYHHVIGAAAENGIYMRPGMTAEAIQNAVVEGMRPATRTPRLADEAVPPSVEQALSRMEETPGGTPEAAPARAALPVVRFTTSQGSIYEVEGQRTTRTKTPHEGHLPGDEGLQPQSEATYYVAPEEARRVGSHAQLSGEVRFLVRDGQLLLLSRPDPSRRWGITDEDRANPIPLRTSPAEGLSPVELWGDGEEGYERAHSGNPIIRVDIQMMAPEAAPAAATAPPSVETALRNMEEAPTPEPPPTPPVVVEQHPMTPEIAAQLESLSPSQKDTLAKQVADAQDLTSAEKAERLAVLRPDFDPKTGQPIPPEEARRRVEAAIRTENGQRAAAPAEEPPPAAPTPKIPESMQDIGQGAIPAGVEPPPVTPTVARYVYKVDNPKDMAAVQADPKGFRYDAEAGGFLSLVEPTPENTVQAQPRAEFAPVVPQAETPATTTQPEAPTPAVEAQAAAQKAPAEMTPEEYETAQQPFGFGDWFLTPDGKFVRMQGGGGLGSERVKTYDVRGQFAGWHNRSELIGTRKEGVRHASHEAANEWLKRVAARVRQLREENAQLLSQKSLYDRFKRGIEEERLTAERFVELQSDGTLMSDADYQAAVRVEQQIDEARNTPLTVPENVAHREAVSAELAAAKAEDRAPRVFEGWQTTYPDLAKEYPEFAGEAPTVPVPIGTIPSQADVTAAETGVRPETAQAETIPARPVRATLPVEQIGVDAPRFQFKSGVDKATGESSALKEVRTWDEVSAGRLTVWEDAAGKYWVVNGHHRLGLARRLGVSEIDSLVLREADGITEADARAIGALQNIREGRGSAMDIAKLMRDAGWTRERLEAEGVSLREKSVASSVDLSALENPLFVRVADGRLPEEVGAAIGREFPRDAAQQMQALSQYEKGGRRGGRVSAEKFRDMLIEQKRAPVITEQKGVGGLFEPEEVRRSLIEEKAEVVGALRRLIGRDRRLVDRLGGRRTVEDLGTVGVSVDMEHAATAREASARLEEHFDNARKYNADLNGILDEGAKRVAAGENPSAVAESLHERTAEVIGQDIEKLLGPGNRSGTGAGGQEQPTARTGASLFGEPEPIAPTGVSAQPAVAGPIEGPTPESTAAAESVAAEAAARINAATPEAEAPAVGMSIRFVRPHGGAPTAVVPAPQSPGVPVFAPPEVTERVERAMEGVKAPSLVQRTADALTSLWHKSTRTYEHLPRGEKYAEVHYALTRLGSRRSDAARRAVVRMKDITLGFDADDLYTFTWKVLVDDLAETRELNPDAALPFGFDAETLAQSQAAVDAAIAQRPDLAEALRKRRSHWNEVKRTIIDAYKAVGTDISDKFTRESYFRHTVLEYAEAKRAASGTGKRMQVPMQRGYMRQRHGSELDISANYFEAEFEVMAQMLADAETAGVLKVVQDGFDSRRTLDAKARQQNYEAMLEHFEPIAEQMNASRSPNSEAPLITAGDAYRRTLNWKQALGWQRLGRLAENGELGDLPAEFQGVQEVLAEGAEQQHEDRVNADDMGERAPAGGPGYEREERALLERLLNWLSTNTPNTEAGIAARTIFKGRAEKQQYVRTTLGRRYQTWQSLVPEGYEVWQPRPGTQVFGAQTLPEALLHALADTAEGEGVTIGPQQLRTVLAQGQRFREWVLPEELAATLDNVLTPERDSWFWEGIATAQRFWKQYVLLNPRRAIPYNLRNLSGDIEPVLRANPGALRKIPEAIQELRNMFQTERAPTGELAFWMKEAGVSGLLQAQEIGDLQDIRTFNEMLPNWGKRPWTAQMARRYWRLVRNKTDFRESVLRYAAYLEYLEQMEGSGGRPRNFGASIPEEVMALPEVRQRALKLSNELLGAYDQLTETGRVLRKYAYPFWSWKEINFSRELRMWRNVLQTGDIPEIGRHAAVSAGRKAAWVGGKSAWLIGGALMVTALTTAYNALRYPKEEGELPDYVKSRPHIVLGRNPDGTIAYMGRLGAVSDILEMVGLDQSPAAIRSYLNGERSLKELVSDMAAAPVQSIYEGSAPWLKMPFEAVGGRSLYPDFRHPRRIQSRLEYLAQQFSFGPEAKLARTGDWGGYAVEAGRGMFGVTSARPMTIAEEQMAEYLRGRTPEQGTTMAQRRKATTIRELEEAIRAGKVVTPELQRQWNSLTEADQSRVLREAPEDPRALRYKKLTLDEAFAVAELATTKEIALYGPLLADKLNNAVDRKAITEEQRLGYMGRLELLAEKYAR